MNETAIEKIERLNRELGLCCKKCNYRRTSQRAEGPPIVHFNPKDKLTSTISYPTEPHPSGLCWYHLKVEEGWFDMQYPLDRYQASALDREIAERFGDLNAMFIK